MWQALHTRLEPLGTTVVTVALDVDPAVTLPFIAAAAPTHPSLVDVHHVTAELFGFLNVPMAVWIDEQGTIVRPAHQASIEPNRLKDAPIPEGLPERMRRTLEEVKAMPGDPVAYRAAIEDWATNGSASRFALDPDEVVARSGARPEAHARAAACFAMGDHLRRTVGHDAAVPWWREAHRLFPGAWNYKRQAWTLVTTPEGADAPDLLQGPNDVYEGSWLDDVVALGGGAAYYPPQEL